MRLQRAASLSLHWGKKAACLFHAADPENPSSSPSLLQNLTGPSAKCQCYDQLPNSLNPSCPKIISPNPKSSPSPQMLGVKRVFVTGFAANWLRSTCFFKLTLPSELATPFGGVGNALEKAWRLGPAPSERVPLPPALGGDWALRRARQITQSKFCACPTNDSWRYRTAISHI